MKNKKWKLDMACVCRVEQDQFQILYISENAVKYAPYFFL